MFEHAMRIASLLLVLLSLVSPLVIISSQTSTAIIPNGILQATFAPYWPAGAKITATVYSASINIWWPQAIDVNGSGVSYYVYNNGMFVETGPITGTQWGSSGSPGETFHIEIIPRNGYGQNGTGLFGTFTLWPAVCSGLPICLLYSFQLNGTPYPGSPLNATGQFTNDGPYNVAITSMSVTFDTQVSNSNNNPLLLGVGDVGSRSVKITIPSNVGPGPVGVTYMFSWKYNGTNGWQYPPNQTASTTFNVTSPPTTTGPTGLGQSLFRSPVMTYLPIIGAFYAIIVSTACILVIRNDHKKIRKLAQAQL